MKKRRSKWRWLDPHGWFFALLVAATLVVMAVLIFGAPLVPPETEQVRRDFLGAHAGAEVVSVKVEERRMLDVRYRVVYRRPPAAEEQSAAVRYAYVVTHWRLEP